MTSPIAKMFATFVRCCRSTAMKPRSSMLRAGGFQVEIIGDRPAPDGDEHHVELARFVFAARSPRR